MKEKPRRIGASRAGGPVVVLMMALLGAAGGTLLYGCSTAQAPFPTQVAEQTPAATPTPAEHDRSTPVPSKPIGRGGPGRPALEVTASPVQTTLLPGQSVSVTWSIKNVSNRPYTIRPFPPETNVSRLRVVEWPSPEDDLMGAEERAWRDPGGSGELVLQTGEVVTKSLNWHQFNNGGGQVAPGYYNLGIDVHAVNLDGGTTGAGNRTSILIQFPQGAMEKSVDVNQSKTVKAGTITLKRVELSAAGTRVYAFGTPSGYRLQRRDGPGMPPIGVNVDARARYWADGQPLKLAGSAGMRYLEDGVEWVWDKLDPISKDAKTMVFTITVAGGMPGPWEFEIPLQ